MFDEFLQKWAKQHAQPFRAFDIATDYKLHVDGKPRYQGVRDFLKSRGIVLPEGTPQDSASAETVCGLGNRKNELVNDRLASAASRRIRVRWLSSCMSDGWALKPQWLLQVRIARSPAGRKCR